MPNPQLSTMREIAIEHLDRYGVISAPIVQNINSNGPAKPSMEESIEVVKELADEGLITERPYSFMWDRK